MRYEAKAQEYFSDLYEEYYLPSPWIRFKEAGNDKIRWCQPDGLLFSPFTGKVTLIEFKLQHTAEAYWQTKYLYLPVISYLWPPAIWRYSIVEVVRWFDADTAFPERVQMLPDVLAADTKGIGVHIWKG